MTHEPDFTRPETHSEASMFRTLWLTYQYTKVNTAVVPQVPLGEVYRKTMDQQSLRYIDALILFKDKRWAVEIKVSASDLRREVAEPEKAAAWAKHVHSFYVMVPEALAPLALEIVPKEYGVMTPHDDRTVTHFTTILRRAKRNRDPLPLGDDIHRRIAARAGRSHIEILDLKARLALS